MISVTFKLPSYLLLFNYSECGAQVLGRAGEQEDACLRPLQCRRGPRPTMACPRQTLWVQGPGSNLRESDVKALSFSG